MLQATKFSCVEFGSNSREALLVLNTLYTTHIATKNIHVHTRLKEDKSLWVLLYFL